MPNAFLGDKTEILEVCAPLWAKGKLFDGHGLGGGFFWMEKV